MPSKNLKIWYISLLYEEECENCGETLLKNNKIGKLFKLQKKAIRILSDKRYSQHTDPLFFELGILKLSDIHRYSIEMVWGMVNGF